MAGGTQFLCRLGLFHHRWAVACGYTDFLLLLILLLLPNVAEDSKSSQNGAEPPKPAAEAAPKPAADSGSTPLNLLGRANTAAGESRRNENVQFNLIDNNALKEAAVRLGTSATIHSDFAPARNYFGGEYGAPPIAPIHLGQTRHVAAGVHGQLFWNHSNNAMTARSFFQVGAVRPSRDNQGGFQAGMPLWKNAWVSMDGALQADRGQVNGNILVPRPEERTILATDPAVRALLQRWLAAYPRELPNRTDIDPRALNTNAPQDIETASASTRLDQLFSKTTRLFLRHTFTNQDVRAFQLAAGQNPDTTTKNHAVRATLSHAPSAASTLEVTAGFDRTRSLLVPEPNHVGPQVTVGTAFTPLGPSSGIPIDRVQNRYRLAAAWSRRAGRHQLSAGGELSRLETNGRENSANRGNWHFRNDFGRDAIANFRLGTPTRFSTAIGDLDRQFRNYEQHYYLGDVWQAGGNLTLSYGLRYQPQLAPRELKNRSRIPYDCDCDNVAPRFGLAWRLPRSAGVVRAAYGMLFGDIYPLTFQQVRWNPPEFLKLEAQNPSLLDPLRGVDLSPTARATVFVVPRNLQAAYSHQYNLSWETRFHDWRLQLGYVGSRTHKLFMMWYTNRAIPVAGIPQTTATINLRRPDPKFFEIRQVLNAARAYFDAGRVTLVAPPFHGLTVDASYWWSKAIDTGATYLNTAAGDDARQGYSQSERLVIEDLRGPSAFDQSHAALARVAYELPKLRNRNRLMSATLGGWAISTVFMKKTGIPFNIISGSDAPGFGNVDGTNGDRPNIIDPSILGRTIGNPDTAQARLPRSAFQFIQPSESRGNLGTGVFRRGGIFNANMSMGRWWTLAGDRSLEFRAEAINATNTPQFADPNPDLTSPAFGKITNTLNDGRVFRLRLALKF